MKKILLLSAACWLGGISGLSAQDAAAMAERQVAEERYQKLAGRVDDLIESREVQRKQLAAMADEIRSLREELGKPKPDSVGRDELKQLAEQVKEVDEKRAADKELILKEISKLGKVSAAAHADPPPPKRKQPDPAPDAGADKEYEGFEHVIKSGDTLHAIVKAYGEQGVKLTVDQILKHPLNKKVDPDKLRVGQKIFIPAPAPAK